MLINRNDNYNDYVSVDSTKDSWNLVSNRFKEEFGDNIYNAWISNLHLISVTEFEITMSVPNLFIKDWISREYFNGKFKTVNGEKICIKKGIKQILNEFYPKLMSFQIIVDKNLNNINSVSNINNIKNNTHDVNTIENNDYNNKENVKSISENDNLYNIGLTLNKNYTFENYVVGDSNRLAYQIAKNIVATQDINPDSNPFFLYGGVGLGKTHLCQAIALKLKETRPDKQIIYLSAEKFMFLFVQSLQQQDINAFKNRFRNVDTLIIDDLQFIVGKDKTQKEFFYTFETLINENKQIILACDKSPINLVDLDEKLKSRINGGLVVDIKEPDYQLRLLIIKNKSKRLGLKLNEELMQYIAENIISNGREIEGCLKRLYINQEIMHITLNKEEIDKILCDNITSNKKVITIVSIQEKVSEYFNVTISDLKSSRRTKELVIPRHIAMYLCKELTAKSYPDIAKSFNGKNHATIIYAVKKIKKAVQENSEMLQTINKIKNLLK